MEENNEKQLNFLEEIIEKVLQTVRTLQSRLVSHRSLTVTCT